jgi:hypothetical protein
MLVTALHALQQWMDSLPVLVQWLMLFVLGALPFIEAFLGTAMGVVTGIPWPLALLATGLGNFAAIVLAARFGSRINRWWRARRQTTTDSAQLTDERRRVQRLLSKYGTVGASIIAPVIIPSILASFLIASSGAPRRLQIAVQTGTFLVLGTIGGLLATAGVDVLSQ